MKKKEDVIVFNYMGRHGSGNMHAYVMAKALIDKGKNVVAIVSSYAENIEAWRKLELTELIEVNTYRNKLEFAFRTIWFYAMKGKSIAAYLGEEYTLMASYSPMLTYWTYGVNRNLNCKKIACNHDPIPHSGDRRKLTFEKEYEESDVIIVHSEKFIEIVKKQYPNKEVVYMPLTRLNVYDLHNKERAVNYSQDKVNFLFFGTISKYKGLEILADAYAITKEKCANVSLTVAGNGDFSPYQEKYEKLKEKDVVVINRWIKDEEVESFFVGNNVVLVLPYTDATQSGVALVAMEYGVPIIATRTGGLEEQISEGENGYLVEARNIEKLAQRMIELAQNPKDIIELKNNMLCMKEQNSDVKLAEQLLDLIQ